MAKVTLEEQADIVYRVRTRLPSRPTAHQIKSLAAAEESLGKLAILRDRIQNLDPEDEDAISLVAEDLLHILGLELLPNGSVFRL